MSNEFKKRLAEAIEQGKKDHQEFKRRAKELLPKTIEQRLHILERRVRELENKK